MSERPIDVLVARFDEHAGRVTARGGTPTVWFDVGGVLAPDVWETVLLSPGGVAERLGVAPEQLAVAAQAVWARHATRPLGLEVWFDDISDSRGAQVDVGVWADASVATLKRLAGAQQMVAAARELGCRVGAISNNTEPFWRMQRTLEPVLGMLDRDLVFVSYEHGAEKSRGLFDVALAGHDPADGLFVDDRDANVMAALARGLAAVRYDPSPSPTEVEDDVDA